jgi:hypothetical protein
MNRSSLKAIRAMPCQKARMRAERRIQGKIRLTRRIDDFAGPIDVIDER